MKINIYAIVVTYNPDKIVLNKLCTTLQRYCSVIVVDNSPVEEAKILVENVVWIPMNGNSGIAAAQNVGIISAINQKAEAVAFFDQDSEPDDSFMPRMTSTFGCKIEGIIAPVCIDIRTGKEYKPFRINKYGLARPVEVFGSNENKKVDMVISSGMLIAAEVFNTVGLMDEDFFIDYVDLEWCIRCKKKGVQITVVNNVIMPHAIGDKVVKNGPFTTFVHSPVRSYYRLRNAFLLFRKEHIPVMYCIHQVISAVIHHIFQLTHTKDKLMHIKYGCRAIFDGIFGIGGKLIDSN